MRGHFSIEWMAQSSSQKHCGTNAETLPGFYGKRLPKINSNHGDNSNNNNNNNNNCESSTEDERITMEEQREKHRSERREETREGFTMQHQTANMHSGMEAGFFGSSAEEETSGYESECGGDPPVTPATPVTPTTPPVTPAALGRRPRTAFTAEQVSSMERAFKRNAYLGTQDKAQLCKKLCLSDKQIRNWFQNRRMKLKRNVQDALAHACQQASVASQLMHYPDLQLQQAYHHANTRAAPYHRIYPATAVSSPTPSPSSSSLSALASLSPLTSGATMATATSGMQQDLASHHHHQLTHQHSVQYGSHSLPLDSFYQYSTLPHIMTSSYPTYPQYY